MLTLENWKNTKSVENKIKVSHDPTIQRLSLLIDIYYLSLYSYVGEKNVFVSKLD